MKLAVILHDVRSVHNVGSIFRTADAVGAAKIVLCGITPSPLDRLKNVRPDFAKVALGAERNVEWEKDPDASGAIARLKKGGWKILALEQSPKSIPYYAVPAGDDDRIALVVGTEVEGLPQDVLNAADGIIEIPMLGAKESLNVSVAFGVAAFGLRYNRRK